MDKAHSEELPTAKTKVDLEAFTAVRVYVYAWTRVSKKNRTLI